LRDLLTIFYWVLDYMRKACLVVVVVYAPTHFWLHFLTLVMSSIFVIIASGYIDARTSRFDRLMDVFNEAKLIVIVYHLCLFTDFVPEPETQNWVGYSCSTALILGTGTNMLMLFIRPIKQASMACKIRSAKKVALAQ